MLPLPLCNPSFSLQPSTVASIPGKPNKTVSITNSASSSDRISSTRRRTMSAFEARTSLIFALASQATSLSQRLVADVATETAKYMFPKRFESHTLEEALMSVPDLETVKFKVLERRDQYEIREVEPYFVAETTMPGKSGFDFSGSSQSFNVLAAYLFGKNTMKEKMEMTTPVFTSKNKSDGVKMDMTTPVLTTKMEDRDKWKMSFVMPSKYGANLPLPKDSSVRIKEVPRKIVAVVSFSGFVNDDEVKQRELKLREALKNDRQFKIKEGTSVEIAQVGLHPLFCGSFGGTCKQHSRTVSVPHPPSSTSAAPCATILLNAAFLCNGRKRPSFPPPRAAAAMASIRRPNAVLSRRWVQRISPESAAERGLVTKDTTSLSLPHFYFFILVLYGEGRFMIITMGIQSKPLMRCSPCDPYVEVVHCRSHPFAYSSRMGGI